MSRPTDFIYSARKYKKTFLYQYDFGFTEVQKDIRDCVAYTDNTYTDTLRYLALAYLAL